MTRDRGARVVEALVGRVALVRASAATMAVTISRARLLRGFVGALGLAGLPSCVGASGGAFDPSRAIGDLEARVRGRVGVFALDTGSGRQVAHRAEERFGMCSTFKWVLAAAILTRVDRGELSLDDRMHYAPGDLLEYAPVARAHAAEGAMSIDALAQAAVTVSDNTAANLLLSKVGGPEGLTRFIRAQGDAVTRLDRTEPSLNVSEPGDPRDTTTPRAMVELLRRVVVGDALSTASRARLLGWMRACETGRTRLRAGLPREWDVGDKTGSCSERTFHDVAVATPPGRAPVVIASYMRDCGAEESVLRAAHAEVGRVVARAFAGEGRVR